MKKVLKFYGVAVFATGAATLLRLALTPLIGPETVPFITFFPAVLLSAWYGGFRPGALCIVLSAAAANYFFVEPVNTFAISNSVDQVALLIFVLVGLGMAVLSHSQRLAVERAKQEASLRKEAEAAERLNREQFETTLASIADAVIATDENGRMRFMNKPAESLTGWTTGEAVGKPLEEVFQLIDAQTRARLEDPALRAIRTNRSMASPGDAMLISKHGRETPIDHTASPIRDVSGKTIGAVLVFRDVTERKEVERERDLLAEQARILNAGFDAVIVRDVHNRIVSWNQVAEDLYGWSAEEAVGQSSHVLLKTVFPKPYSEITGDLHRDGRWAGELIHACKDGSLLTVLSHWILDRDDDGAPRSILQINLDISARKRAEESLREQRELLRVTLSSIGDAVIATDMNGAVTFLNPVAESLTGWNQEDAIGQPLENVFRIVNEQTREGVGNPALRAMQEGMVVGLANHTVLLSKDGREIPIDDAGSPIQGADGKIIGAVLIFRDVTERRRVERERADALGAAKDASREKDQLLAMVSHELRNPLTAILGWVTIMRRAELPAERVAHALQVIEKNARLEAQLVDSLLDLSRIVAGKLKLAVEQLDLTPLIQTVVDSIRPAAEEKGIAMEFSMPGEPLIVMGDSARLQQIFSNLLTNAVKFTSRAGRIVVRAAHADASARVQVIDNGEGIAPDVLPHVFDRFRQADASKSAQGGLGLGLAIVSELVNAHGGMISAESRGKDQGATFTVSLPLPG